MAWTERHGCGPCMKRNIDQIMAGQKATPNSDCEICKGEGHYWKIHTAPKGRF